MSIPGGTEYTTRHTITVAAPPDDVYALIADAEHWPTIFPPSIHVRHKQESDRVEILDIWASATDTVKAWSSRRELDAENRTVTFHQIVSAPPVASMSGIWQILADDVARSTVILEHRFAAVDDDPESVAWIKQALETNSTAELDAISATAIAEQDGSVISFAFSDSVSIDADAQPIFDFLYQADLWPQRLPHVSRSELSYVGDAQVLEMDTVNDVGDTHTTRSYRVITDQYGLAYKQTVLPDGFLAHHGKWTLDQNADGTLVTSQHRVRIDLDRLREQLGINTRAGIEQRIRTALGGNSIHTLTAAKSFAESQHTVA